MKRPLPHADASHEHGFVLVTSLIFLVVITLLAVSAISSSTLQEHMASNARDKSRALQAADAALRQGEMLLRQPRFDTYQPAGASYAVTVNGNSTNATTTQVTIWRQDAMFASNPANPSLAFLDPALWKKNTAQTYTPDPKLPAVQFFIEDMNENFQPRDLNPDTTARADGGAIYRITARAKGQNPAAVAVTQSLYEKRY